MASQYGRYGYRRIKSLLDEAGWNVGCDRVQRIWRREGLKVPKKQKPRGRLWLNGGSCIRLRPERRNHVWSYDFVEAQTHDGRKLRLMTLIDEFTRECLAIRVARRINSFGVLETMADVMLMRGVPEHVRSDNGAEMTAKVVRNWLMQVIEERNESEGEFATAEHFEEEERNFERPMIEMIVTRPFRDAAFATSVKSAYDNTCAMTGIQIINGGGRAEVQAAHIRPVSDGGSDSVRNGLALSSTVHWMFDRGLVSVGDDFSILIAAGRLPPAVTRMFREDLRVGFESHEARAMRRTRSMTEAA